jgi:hypothetical protein
MTQDNLRSQLMHAAAFLDAGETGQARSRLLEAIKALDKPASAGAVFPNVRMVPVVCYDDPPGSEPVIRMAPAAGAEPEYQMRAGTCTISGPREDVLHIGKVIHATSERDAKDARFMNELSMMAQLMDEAAGNIRLIPEEIAGANQVRHFLPDELEGSALMIRAAQREQSEKRNKEHGA